MPPKFEPGVPTILEEKQKLTAVTFRTGDEHRRHSTCGIVSEKLV